LDNLKRLEGYLIDPTMPNEDYTMQKDLPDTEIQATEFSDKKEEFIEKKNLKVNS
jgi:hypothetical protein